MLPTATCITSWFDALLQTFIDKLTEHSISYCVSDHEADPDIAHIAAQWECPVVSDDSDFLLYDLPGGIIFIEDLLKPPIQ